MEAYCQFQLALDNNCMIDVTQVLGEDSIMVNPTIIWWGNNLYYSRLTSERSLCIYMVSSPRTFFLCISPTPTNNRGVNHKVSSPTKSSILRLFRHFTNITDQ